MNKSMKKYISIILTLILIFSVPVSAADIPESQWYLSAIGLADVDDDLRFNSDAPVVIAVIDTGLDTTHPAFADCLWENTAEKNGLDGVDDDGNGYIDDIYGYNVKAETGNITDKAGHGTHVSGIIAMNKTEREDITGVMPAAKIMTVKAADSENGFSTANLIKALKYATENDADIINMSIGAGFSTDELISQIRISSEKALIVAAAGNSGDSIKEEWHISGTNIFPAIMPEVLGVMSHSQAGEKSSFSNYDLVPDTGLDYDLIAPGEAIYSTYLVSSVRPNYYRQISGTSMATPIVSASAAILHNEWNRCFPGDPKKCTPAILKECLVKGTGDTVEYSPSEDTLLSFPKLNVPASLKYLHEHYIDPATLSGNGTISGNDSVSDNNTDPAGDTVSDNDTPPGNGGNDNSGSDNNSGNDNNGGNNDNGKNSGGQNGDGNNTDNNNENKPSGDGSQNKDRSSGSGNSNDKETGNTENIGGATPSATPAPSGKPEDPTGSKQDIIKQFKSLRPVLSKKSVIKKGRKLTGRVKLSYTLSDTGADGFYLYTSKNKNKGYKKTKTVRSKKKLTVKRSSAKRYCYIRSYKIINGKKYLSKKSNRVRL